VQSIKQISHFETLSLTVLNAKVAASDAPQEPPSAPVAGEPWQAQTFILIQ
jgi:hypothetical protein